MATEHDPFTPETEVDGALNLVLGALDDCEKNHISFVDKVEKRYRAYRGIAPPRANDDVDNWRSNLTTPYILQTVEGMIATMLMPNPQWHVSPYIKPGDQLEQALARVQQRRILEIVLGQEMHEDGFHLKQRPFMQQDIIAGLTVAKQVYRYDKGRRSELVPQTSYIEDGNGMVVDSFVTLGREEKEVVLRNGPSMIVRDVRDFMWPSSAKNLEDAPYVIDRVWTTFDDLKKKEALGIYKGVDEIKTSRDIAAMTGYNEREQLLRDQERNEGLIEVIEYWTDNRVITVGARKVVLADRPNPLGGSKPFVVCSSLPDAFQMQGISVVEVLAPMQEYLWTLQNQRLDNLRLLNNLITLIRSDVDDPDAFEFFPGAQWFVEDPNQVSTLPIDPTVAQISLEAEQLIKGDLQNVMGGLPMAGGVSSGTIDQSTATGMSIITSIAQRMIQARQSYFGWSYAKIGEQFLQILDKFGEDERAYQIEGKDGDPEIVLLNSVDFQGEWRVRVDVMDESMMRQEKRAEASSLLQVAANVSQMMPLNMQAFMENVLDAYGIIDKERYFSNTPPPSGVPGPIQQGEAAAPGTIMQGMTGQNQGGITNPDMAAGANGLSASPENLMARRVNAVEGMR